MNFAGNIVQIYRDYGRRKWMITLETDQDITEEYERLKDKVVSAVIKLFRKSRSLNANAYYWQLLGKICEVTGENAAYRHNMNLRECGYIELIDGQAVYVVIPDTEEAERKVDAYESVHLKPTSQIKGGKDGKLRCIAQIPINTQPSRKSLKLLYKTARLRQRSKTKEMHNAR